AARAYILAQQGGRGEADCVYAVGCRDDQAAQDGAGAGSEERGRLSGRERARAIRQSRGVSPRCGFEDRADTARLRGCAARGGKRGGKRGEEKGDTRRYGQSDVDGDQDGVNTCLRNG